MIHFRTHYHRVKTPGIECGGGRTKVNHANECDINQIMKKFQKTGVLPETIKKNPQYGNFAEAHTYQEAQNIVILAQEQFQGLPSAVRERFGNDPQNFLAYASNPQNAQGMVDLGLATKRATTDNVVEKTPKKMGGGKNGSPEAKSESQSD